MNLSIALVWAGTTVLGLTAASVRLTAQTASPSSSLPPVEAGLGKGVTIRSTDDKASLNLRARLQVRSTLIADPEDSGVDTTDISIRRMRLVFQGNAAGPPLTYFVQLSFSNLDNETDLRLPLRDAFVTWAPTRDINLRLGQMKVPFSRQRLTQSAYLQMVDRSIVVSELNLDRDVGLQVFSRNLFGVDKLGYAVGLFGGEGRNRLGRVAGVLYTARLEAWPLGPFDDLVEGDLQRSDRLRIAFGADVGYNQNTNRPRSTIGTPFPVGDFDYTHAGADAVMKMHGWSVTSEWMYRQANQDAQTLTFGGAPTTLYSRSGWGWFVQGGRMMSERLEITARYGRLRPSLGTDPTFVDGDEAGAGFSYYISRHDRRSRGITSRSRIRPLRGGCTRRESSSSCTSDVLQCDGRGVWHFRGVDCG